MIKKSLKVVCIPFFVTACGNQTNIDKSPSSTDFDYNDYISFEPSPEAFADGIADMFQIEGEIAFYARKAIAEIAKTPEGQYLIQKAYNQNETGKINVIKQWHLDDPESSSANFEQMRLDGKTDAANDLALSQLDSLFGYYCHGDTEQKLEKFSLQHVIFHELYHLAHHRNESQSSDAAILRVEMETVAATDAFITKYYSECPRVDYQTTDMVFDNTPPSNELPINFNHRFSLK